MTPGWGDHRAPLRAGNDSTLTLSFDGPQDAPVYWSVPLLLAPEASDNRPNIVVIVVDALRADVVGAYGALDSTMPSLDRLASEGVLVRRAYAAASWTKPSITTLLTSLYPWTHALGARYYADALPRNVPTLQSTLSANGYVTAQFSANPFTGAASGLDHGFDAALMAPPFGRQEAFAVTAADIVDRFLDWADAHAQDRYFAYLHLVDAHGAQGLDGYRRAARTVDTQIARLRSRLGPLAANTLFVITADHGEAFGDHGQSGHGQSVYEEEVRVPLIIHEPGQRTGRVIDEPVHLVDVMPTVLDYAGVSVGRPVMQGRSLRPAGIVVRPSPVVVTKFRYPDDVAAAGDRSEMHAILDFPWKLITTDRPGEPRARELYRLDTDPGEKQNLASADAVRAPARDSAHGVSPRTIDGARALCKQVRAWRQAATRAAPNARGSTSKPRLYAVTI